MCQAETLGDLYDLYQEALFAEIKTKAWQEWLAFAPFAALFGQPVKPFNEFIHDKKAEQDPEEVERDLDVLRAWANKGG